MEHRSWKSSVMTSVPASGWRNDFYDGNCMSVVLEPRRCGFYLENHFQNLAAYQVAFANLSSRWNTV